MIDIPTADEMLRQYLSEKKDWLPELEKYVAGILKRNARDLVNGKRVNIHPPNFRHTDWRQTIWDDHLLTLKSQLTALGYTVWDGHVGAFDVQILHIGEGS